MKVTIDFFIIYQIMYLNSIIIFLCVVIYLFVDLNICYFVII